MNKVKHIVGISGGSGSGKTTIVNHLIHRFARGATTLICQDNYYLSREQQPTDNNGVINFDTLQSVDFPTMVNDIENLIEGKSIHQRIYTFNNPSLKENTIETHPSEILFIEGVFIFAVPSLLSKIDYKIFVDVPNTKRLRRRIKRDNIERGYGMGDVLYRFEKHVEPAFEDHVLPFRKQADYIIQNTESVENVVEKVYSAINSNFGF